MAVDWDKPIRMVFEVGGGSEAVRYLGSRKGPESYRRHIVAVDYGDYEGVVFADDCGRVNKCCRVINVPEKHVRWVNCYPPEGPPDRAHETRDIADKSACRSRIACVRIEFEDGEGL